VVFETLERINSGSLPSQRWRTLLNILGGLVCG